MKSSCNVDEALAQLGAELSREMSLVGIENPNWASMDHRLQLTTKVRTSKLAKVMRLIELCDYAIEQIEYIEKGVNMWHKTENLLPREGSLIEAMDCGGNTQDLVFKNNLFWFTDFSMYIYYTPIMWRYK